MSKPVHDRFDDVPHTTGRVGAHRAEQPGMNGLVVLLWSVVTALVLIIAGVFAAMLLMGRISFSAETEPPPAPDAVVAQVDTSVRVLILNATPDETLVTAAREVLLAEGWAAGDVFGSDAASQGFATTTVFYVDAAQEAAALGLADLLGAEVQQSDAYAALNDSDRPQLTVVIGLDRTTGATPPPTED